MRDKQSGHKMHKMHKATSGNIWFTCWIPIAIDSMSGAQATVEEWLNFAIRSAHILVMFPSHNFAVQNGYFAFVLFNLFQYRLCRMWKDAMQQPEDATFLSLIELQ